MMRSVSFIANTLTWPLLPAATVAALAMTDPSYEFNVETRGWFNPVGQIDKYASGPCGMTVRFNEMPLRLWVSRKQTGELESFAAA